MVPMSLSVHAGPSPNGKTEVITEWYRSFSDATIITELSIKGTTRRFEVYTNYLEAFSQFRIHPTVVI